MFGALITVCLLLGTIVRAGDEEENAPACLADDGALRWLQLRRMRIIGEHQAKIDHLAAIRDAAVTSGRVSDPIDLADKVQKAQEAERILLGHRLKALDRLIAERCLHCRSNRVCAMTRDGRC